MGHVFYDIFSIINVSCMHLKFYLDLPIQNYVLQTGSYADDIGILLLGDMRYTSLGPTLFYFMTFNLFLSFSIYTLSYLLLALDVYLNYEILF